MSDADHRVPRGPQRIIDVSVNRALEAARVLDDAARFLLDDALLAGEAKALRHELRALAESMPSRLAERDVERDVGTGQTADTESVRRSPAEVAHAAGHRLAESLRSLEEWSKLIDPVAAQRAKALRYRGYALHQAVASRLAGTVAQWRVCVLVTEASCRRPWEEVVEAAVVGGADAIQLREKGMSDRELLARARRTVGIVAGRAAVVINDRADLALLAGADGVHVGDDDLDVTSVRALAGRRLVIGASTHSIEDVDAAVAAGADVIGVGTIFASSTKLRAATGVSLLAAVIARHPTIAHLAIGGVDPGNVAELRAVGCRGVAVSGCVCGSEDPRRTVELLRAAFECKSAG